MPQSWARRCRIPTRAAGSGGRALLGRMYAGRGSTNSKAAEPGRPTALRRLSNRLGRGAPTLRPPHASKRDQGPRSDQKSIGFAQSTSSGLFAAAELTGDPACLYVVGLIVFALAVILGSVRGDRELKKTQTGAASGPIARANFTTFTAIRRASSRVSSLAAERRPVHSYNKRS